MSKVYPVGYQDLTPVEDNNNEEENDKGQAEDSYTRRNKTETDQISIIRIEEDPVSTVLEEKRNERIFSVKSLKKEEQTASAIQLEKIKHEWKLNVRNQTFTKILFNESIQIDWKRFCLQILATILLTASISSFITIIPFQNTVLYPEYWYESMIQLIPNSISWAVFYAVMDAYFLNCMFIREIRYVLKMCLASNILKVVLYCAFYYYWTQYMGMNWPLFFIGFFVPFPQMFLSVGMVWFRCLEWRKNPAFRKRLNTCMWMNAWGFVINFQYLFATRFISMLQGNNYQPIMALVLILIREGNGYIFNKFLGKTSSGDEPGAQIVGSYYLGGRHSLQVCIYIGAKANLSTAYMLMGIDFLTNIYLAIKTIWIHKKHSDNTEKQIDLLQELSLNEIGEFLIPLGFVVVQTMAYFGPNSDKINDVGSDWWDTDKIEDIWASNMAVLEFFIIDFASTIITGLMLWFFCGINLLKAMATMFNEFFLPLAAITAYWIFNVCK